MSGMRTAFAGNTMSSENKNVEMDSEPNTQDLNASMPDYQRRGQIRVENYANRIELASAPEIKKTDDGKGSDS